MKLFREFYVLDTERHAGRVVLDWWLAELLSMAFVHLSDVLPSWSRCARYPTFSTVLLEIRDTIIYVWL